MSAIVDQLKALGLHPSPLPLGLIRAGRSGRMPSVQHLQLVSLQASARRATRRCAACVPAARHDNVELATNTLAARLVTNASGTLRRRRWRCSIAARRASAPRAVSSSCHAAPSTPQRCCSAPRRDNTRRASPTPRASSGRRYMAHLATMMQGFHPFRVNTDVFQKTVAINDFYLRGPGPRVPARPDPVAGAHARRHGADRRPVDSALGVRRVGCARRRLARACPRICRIRTTA